MNYFLRSADGKKAYRLVYSVVGAGIELGAAFATGYLQTLSSGQQFSGVDVPVRTDVVFVDYVLGNVVPATVAEYRTIAAATTDSLSAAQKAAYPAQWG